MAVVAEGEGHPPRPDPGAPAAECARCASSNGDAVQVHRHGLFGAAVRPAILLRQESRAGHAVGKPLHKQAGEAADVLAFSSRQLGRG